MASHHGDDGLAATRRTRSPVVAALITFVLACALPTLLFVFIGLGADDTAETKVSAGTLATLVGIELLAGAALAALVWAVMSYAAGTARSLFTALIVFGAGGWGMATGFLGSVAISYERHPGWDDA